MATLKEELVRNGLVKEEQKDTTQKKDEFGNYLDKNVVTDFSGYVTSKKKSIYKYPIKGNPFFKKENDIIYPVKKIMELEERMKITEAKKTSEYIILSIIKRRGEATHNEIVEDFKKVKTTIKDASIRTTTTRMASVVPNVIEKIPNPEVKSGIKFKFASTEANDDLDTAFALFLKQNQENRDGKPRHVSSRSKTTIPSDIDIKKELESITASIDFLFNLLAEKTKPVDNSVDVTNLIKLVQQLIISQKNLSPAEVEFLKM